MVFTPDYQPLLDRITAWAEARPDIRAAIIIGSRARTDHPADAFSDLDIVVLATDPQRYLADGSWLREIGEPWLTFIERTATGDASERRALFAGGLDVDFALTSARKGRTLVRLLRLQQRHPGLVRRLPASWRRALPIAQVLSELAARGVRLLVDKDGTGASLAALGRVEAAPAGPPSEAEFLQVTNDFWYHSVWTAKKICRGELWTAQSCCDSYMKWLLLRVVEWQARASRGWEQDTWHSGRFLEEWADPRAVAGLRWAFAHYDRADLQRALLATMDLFRELATEVAERLGYVYPAEGAAQATALVEELLEESG